MKIFFKSFFLYALTGLFFLIQPCVAAEKTETVISYINLNNTAYYDIEILLLNGEKILLPFKQLSEIFEVKVKTNHSTKEIDFQTSDGKTGRVGKNYIQYNGKKFSNEKNFYLKSGLMDEIKDEIFCNEKDLSVIFDAKISTDKNDLSLRADTEKELAVLQTEIENNDELSPKFKAFTNVEAPDKEKKVLFNSISLNNNTMSDTISNYFLNNSKTSQKNIFFNNNTQIVLKGKAYGGDLNIDLNTYNYKGELFSFGGLGFNYHNNHKGIDYELGRVRGIKDDDYTIANQMLGIQFGNYETRKKTYRDINGYVSKDSLAKVFIDNEEYTTLSTYDGYYSLSNLYLNKDPKSIKIEELKSDGSTQTVYEKKYPKYENMPAAKQKKYTAFAGVTGFNNRLFNTNGYIYEMNTKKLVAGAQYEYGIKDNLKLDSKIIFDKIYSKPQNSIWQSIHSTDALLTSGTWKNPNHLEGISNLNTIEYIKNDNLKYKTSLGISTVKDTSLAESQKPGYSLTAQAEYKKDKYNFKAGIFNTSPDFYLAGSDGSYINDRTGAFIRGNFAGNGCGIDGSLKKYFSNADKRFEGGLINFTEYSFGARKNFEKFADFRFNINGREGNNSIAQNSSYYYDLNFSKRIKSDLQIQAGKSESNYQTKYDDTTTGNSGFKSKYSTVYLKADYRLPKNAGTISLGHDIINYNYSDQENKYNMMKVGYTFPEIKRVTLSLGTGYKYTGSDNGFDFSVNLAYRTKSGRTVNVNYQYNQMGGYIINNMYLPLSSRHSINLVLNDTFAVLPSGLKSVGFYDDNRGYADITAYIDKNKNGKYDKEDIPVKNVPIICSWVNKETYTKRNGKVIPPGTEAGIYRIKIDTDKLNATLYQEKGITNEKIVRIDAKKTTRIEFPLKSCIGNITGNLKIVDDFGRTKNIKDFIVVINNEKNEEVAYSTVDSQGKFYFSGIEPGKYIIKLDDSFINSNALEDFENKSLLNIDIPYTYKDFVDLNNLELVYKAI